MPYVALLSYFGGSVGGVGVFDIKNGDYFILVLALFIYFLVGSLCFISVPRILTCLLTSPWRT